MCFFFLFNGREKKPRACSMRSSCVLILLVNERFKYHQQMGRVELKHCLACRPILKQTTKN